LSRRHCFPNVATVQADSHRQQKGLRSSLIFALLLAIFLGVHLLLSLALSGSFAPDDADQLIFSQSFAWGYYEQPPLYSWLTYVFFRLFGLSYLSYDVVKSIALGSVYVTSFLCARLLAADHRSAILAAFSPLLIPSFAWHSFSYLTSTNLVCAAGAASCYLLLRLQRYGRLGDYLALGLTLGLGFLSKYNFLFLATAFFVAGLTIRSFRARLLNFRILFTLGIATLLVLPNTVWLVEHRTALVPVLAQKLEVNRSGLGWDRMLGVSSLFSNLFLILLPAALIWLFFRRYVTRVHPLTDTHHLLARFFLAALGLLLLLVLVSGATHFHERWLQPLTLLVPLYGWSCYRFASRSSLRVFGLVLLGIALICAGVRGGQIFFGGLDRGTYPLQMNLSPAVQQLQGLIKPGSVVVSRDREICGNLRYHFPAARHLCSSHPLYVPPLDSFNGARVLVWNTADGNTPPADLRIFVTQTLNLLVPENAAIHVADVPPKLAGRRFNRLVYVMLSN
jgi:4-amino-4-deoxy-L-arabinose transferase-like glycosyltransferase